MVDNVVEGKAEPVDDACVRYRLGLVLRLHSVLKKGLDLVKLAAQSKGLHIRTYVNGPVKGTASYSSDRAKRIADLLQVVAQVFVLMIGLRERDRSVLDKSSSLQVKTRIKELRSRSFV